MTTFCFLVTRDLVKEALWRSWFEELTSLGFTYSIATHCSDPSQIKSEWLRSTLIPINIPTSWEFHTYATLALYNHVFTHSESKWITLHSESCVPIVSAKQFVDMSAKYSNKSILNHSPIWWDPAKIGRANLIGVPPQFRIAHQEWCILTREDLAVVLRVAANTEFTKKILSGPAADESFVGVCLAFHDRLKDVINARITMVDWKRSPNGNNPHTFQMWTSADQEFYDTQKSEHPMVMFLRKVGTECPDSILQSLWL